MKNKLLRGEIVEANFPNKNIVKTKSGDFRIKGGILGQEVEIKKTRRDKAKLLNIINKSNLENIDGCIHRDCGGCTYDAMAYEDEVNYKEKLLQKLFKDHGYDFDFHLMGNSHYTCYRNKMEYTFGDEYKGSEIALGLHKKNRFYEIENTTDCRIVHEDMNKIRYFTREYFKDCEFYNRMRHTGVLRHLMIRRTNYGEILINLVTVSEHNLELKGFVKGLLNLELDAKIVGIVHTLNDSLSDAIINEGMEILYGRDYCVEELHGLKFKIGPFSFFQTNSYSAETLYSIAIEYLGEIEGKNILDLYSGTGTITQILGQNAKSALGIEIVEDAVRDAIANAEENKIGNVDFIAGDVLKEVENLDFDADVVVLDPPREGIHPKAIGKILEFKPEEFLYISCNPASLARDLEEFIKAGYEVDKICGLDQFPRTMHVECIVLMSRK